MSLTAYTCYYYYAPDNSLTELPPPVSQEVSHLTADTADPAHLLISSSRCLNKLLTEGRMVD